MNPGVDVPTQKILHDDGCARGTLVRLAYKMFGSTSDAVSFFMFFVTLHVVDVLIA